MFRHPKTFIFSLIRLSKPIITLSVAFSALAGFILKAGAFKYGWFLVYVGVILVAASSSVINMIQEARTDALMERTRSRPIPSGLISRFQASVYAVILGLTGLTILWCYAAFGAALVAAITLFWYNVVYTPLKKITPWAILPGAVVGALPPLIGWIAAGGHVLDQKIVFLSFFFFIGQIPHFWLILLKHGKDYKNAGFPAITDLLNPTQIARLTFLWTVATAVSAVLLPLFGIITHPITVLSVVVFSLALILFFAKWPGLKQPLKVERAFLLMNMYFLWIMIAVIADSVYRG